MIEDLDHFLPVHHLLHEAFLYADRLLQADEVPGGAAAQLAGEQNHDNDAQQENKRQPDAVIQHHEEHADNNGAGTYQRRQGLPDQLTQRVDVVRVIGHNIAVLVRIEVTDGEILHPVEHGLTHFAEKALRNNGGKLCFDRHGNDGQHVETDQKHDLGDNHAPRRIPRSSVGKAVVNDIRYLLQEDRRQDCHDGGKHDAGDRNRNQHRIVAVQHPDRAVQNRLVHFPLLRHSGGIAALLCRVIMLHPAHLLSTAVRKLPCISDCAPAVRRACRYPPRARCP